MTLLVLENIEKSHQRKLFTILGVDYVVTSRTWMNIPLMAMTGIGIALIFAPVDELLSEIVVGIGYGILIIISANCHAVGHIVSSRIVNAPMKSLISTATVNVTYYDDHEERSSYVHVGRAVGGPALSLLLGLITIAIYIFAANNHFILFFGIVNLVIAATTLSPIPSLDGEVILRELRAWKK